MINIKKVDYHIHTNWSHDGKVSMDEMAKSAIEKGQHEICLTEHYDLDNIDPKFKDLKPIDFKEYYKEYKNISEKYASKISVKMGVEIGLQPHIYNELEMLVNSNSFDFVIASSHIVDKLDLGQGTGFYEGKTQREVYKRYLEEVLVNVKNFHSFDVYGHLDYIVRYGGYKNRYLKYTEYADILDEILKTIVQSEKGIEVNTSGIRYGLESVHPNIEILKRYKELGGEIVTVGSDAHMTKDIASNFKIATDMLKEGGFRYISRFERRNAIFEKL